MKRIVFLFLFVFLWMGDVFASKEVHIFFVNGMFSDRNSSEDCLWALRKKLDPELPDGVEIRYTLAYNQQAVFSEKGFPVVDWGKSVLAQAFDVFINNDVGNVNLFWRWIDGSFLAPGWFLSMRNELVIGTDFFDYVRSDVLDRHIDGYNKVVDRGKHVIVVAYSEGNFYANAAYRFTDPEYFDVVAIGSLAEYVVGDGLHITMSSDDVVNFVRKSYVFVLGPNPLSKSNALVSGDGHSFIGNYLDGDVSGPIIIGAILKLIEGFEDMELEGL